MRSIAIINQKGGVGKTTTAVNLSAALARAGQRVGLIDIDPQAHASLHLGLDPQRQRADGLRPAHRRHAASPISGSEPGRPRPRVEENLWVAASHIDLAAAEVELAGVVGREVILRDKLAEAADEFDYVLIDCPPSLGILTINALAAVDDVFLPLQPHFLALHGLSQAAQNDRPRERAAQRSAAARRRRAVPVRIGHEAGRRSQPATSSSSSAKPARAAAPGAPCGCSKRASAATSAWPKRPASANRSSNTPPTRPAPKTTAPWAAKCSPTTPAARCSKMPLKTCRRVNQRAPPPGQQDQPKAAQQQGRRLRNHIIPQVNHRLAGQAAEERLRRIQPAGHQLVRHVVERNRLDVAGNAGQSRSAVTSFQCPFAVPARRRVPPAQTSRLSELVVVRGQSRRARVLS